MLNARKKRWMWLGVVLVLIITAILLLQPKKVPELPKGENVGLGVGQLAPDFELQDKDGKLVKLSEYRGKAVFINFWASWCPFCIDEMPDIQQAYTEFKDKGLVVLAINRGETRTAGLTYATKLRVQITYPLLFDPDEQVSRIYITRGMPVSYFLDAQGIITARYFGPIDIDTMRTEAAKALATKPEIDARPSVGVKDMVNPDDIVSVLPRDAIPALTRPKFTTAGEAAWLQDTDTIIGVFYKGEARAYPLRIFNWHEIVNDVIRGDPLLISYCPLCDTSIGFHRDLPDGSALEFGVSGKLYNSQLVMYDRKTESLWTQTRGQAVVGPLSGTMLKPVLVETMPWKEWKQLHPETTVLSRETGYSRDYDRDPYAGYPDTPDTLFPVLHKDSRLPQKERVYGIHIDGIAKAYPLKKVLEQRVINDAVGNDAVAVFGNPDTQQVRFFNRAGTQTFAWKENKIIDEQTNSEWSMTGLAIAGSLKGTQLTEIVPERHFWFSWAAFNQETELYS
ncbi:DUF3179 domain-containing protein [Candidatus Woesearchaeota archaeon]|nr:DUF3179 domain-containing protein [Candidatus Woesearchaeota archaeon]